MLVAKLYLWLGMVCYRKICAPASEQGWIRHWYSNYIHSGQSNSWTFNWPNLLKSIYFAMLGLRNHSTMVYIVTLKLEGFNAHVQNVTRFEITHHPRTIITI